jgi:hypothetical protein
MDTVVDVAFGLWCVAALVLARPPNRLGEKDGPWMVMLCALGVMLLLALRTVQ